MPNTPKMNTSIVDDDFPVVREDEKTEEFTEEVTETFSPVNEDDFSETVQETTEVPLEEETPEESSSQPVQEETTTEVTSEEPAQTRAIELHEIQAEEGEDLLDMLDLFDEDDNQGAAGSAEKPKLVVNKPNDLGHLYDHRAATAAKEKARMMAPKADGAKATELVEAENALVAEGENVELDDLDWLNDEEDNYVFEDLFPEIEGEALELQDGTAPMLAIEGEGGDQEQEKLNALEEALVRLKKKRGREEMTPEQAENVMEELICRMTTAADEDGETIRKNMAKARLQRMMEKEKAHTGFLAKKENHQRFAKLFKIAEFPNSKEMMKSFWDEKQEKEETVKSFSSKKARIGTMQLLKRYPEEPAMQKMMILNFCCKEITKPDYMNWFVTFGGLSVLKTWLSPNPDGTLPALTLRTEVLKVLQKLPVSNAALRKSGLGKEVNALLKSSQETLQNRKVCQELISKWLSNVLETETSIKRHRMETQHRMASKAQPAKKKQKTQQEQARLEKESRERRHPQMFQKPSHNFVAAPESEVASLAAQQAQFRQTRKGKIAKHAGELRALRPASRHVHVDISGSKMNTTKGTWK